MYGPKEKAQTNSDFSANKTSKEEEAGWLEGLRRKENWAYKILIDRWAQRLYQVAFRFLRQEEAAQDILQDVLKKVVEKIDTFKGESSIYTWLYRITVNECLMKIRSNKKRPMVSWEDILPKYEDEVITTHQEFADWSKLSDTKLMEKEAREFIRQCVEELPEDYRAPYILKDLEQFSEQEVCDVLDLKKSVMKIRVHRARMYIRKKLEERYVTEA